MSTLYPDIKTKNWQISTAGIGIIAQGLADIRQCIDLLLRTQKGTDPLRPDFGSDIFQYVDKPLNFAIPNIKQAIVNAVNQWETRVTVDSIRDEINESNVIFFITYKLVDEELIDLLVLYLIGGFVTVDLGQETSIILNALYPYNPTDKRYTISFSVNGDDVLPQPPSDGFGTILQLFNWVTTNWPNFGRWVQLSDKIVLYMNTGIAQTASLSISLIGSNRFFGVIPEAAIGQDYALSFSANGSPAIPAPPSPFVSIGDMLDWANANWNVYGTWSVQSNPAVGGDFDLSDFDEIDFTTGFDAVYLLVLISDTVNTAEINVALV